ncbi:MAG: hypothetical protein R3F20_00025 [Planctomycetota bacterium]
MHRSLTLLALAVALLAGSAAAQNEDDVRQTAQFDAFRLGRHLGADAGGGTDLPLRAAYVRSPEEFEGRDLVEAEFIIDLVRSAIRPDSWDEEGAEISIIGHRISVTHTPEVVAEVRTFMAALEAALLSPLVVELWESPGARPGSVTAEEARALIGVQGARLLARRTMIAGQSMRMGSTERTAFVGDLDVEVAQKSRADDPQTMVVNTGTDLCLTAGWTVNGQLYLDAVATISRLEELRRRPSGSANGAEIELPRVASRRASGTGVVAPGGGIVLVAGERAGAASVLLRVSGAAPTETFGPGFSSASLIALTTMERRFPPISILQSRISFDGPDVEEGQPLVEADWLVELLQRAAGPDWFDAPGNQINMLNDRVFLRGAPEQVAPMRLRCGAMEREFPTHRVEFRVVELSDLAGDPLVHARESKKVVASGGTSAMDGRSFRILAGREIAVLMDLDVEIAQEAQTHDPVVGLVFDGYVFDGRVTRMNGDRLALRGVFTRQDLAASEGLRQPEFVDKTNGVQAALDQPATGGTRQEIAMPVEPGAWSLASVFSGSRGTQALLVRIDAQ